jgi:hypothetical protein
MPKIERIGYFPCPCEQRTPFEMTHIEQDKEGGDHHKMEQEVKAEVQGGTKVAHATDETEQD